MWGCGWVFCRVCSFWFCDLVDEVEGCDEEEGEEEDVHFIIFFLYFFSSFFVVFFQNFHRIFAPHFKHFSVRKFQRRYSKG